MLPTSIYTLAIFTSAFLLFLIQPMISKLLLPHLGGTPALWNTAMMFFQILLLCGYAYAHLTGKWLGAKKQAVLHLVLLLVALAWLPIVARTDIGFASAMHPISWVMLSLLLSVGVPFFVLAANAPLLQSWLSHTSHKDAHNPYFLYSASNIGSLLALFSYPFVMEPLLTLSMQTYVWSAVFVLFCCLMLGCIAYMRAHYVPLFAPSATAPATKPTLSQKFYWVALAFCPSSLLLGVTTYITTDLASLPLFWIIPLAIYLLTFIFAFARTPLMVDRALNAQVVLVPITAMAFVFSNNAVASILILHLFTFFAMVMGCHGTLARHKPDPRYLTEYFLWISFGGMLGGVFNALIAPNIFVEPIEYPLVFILTLLLRPQLIRDTLRERTLDYVVPAAFMLLIWLIFRVTNITTLPGSSFSHAVLSNTLPVPLYVPIIIAAIRTYKRPLRFALVILAIFLAVPLGKNSGDVQPAAGSLIYVERNFFGVNRLFAWAPTNARLLMHGTTLHGMQPQDPAEHLKLTSYYGVLRDVNRHLDPALKDNPVAALGLGIGTVACLGNDRQVFDFYEIDPMMQAIASNPEFFTYLKDCPPHSNIILGDGRLKVSEAGDHRYGLMIIDTFSSDSIPIHIITREALAIYLSKLADGGIMAFNISNRHLNLAPLMHVLAADAGLTALIKEDPNKSGDKLITPSQWVIMARDLRDFHGLEKEQLGWRVLETTKKFDIWTDNYSNIFETLF